MYPIHLSERGMVMVYCDQRTDGGGWTVIQRRSYPFSESFNRTWLDYQRGFGNPSGEFWLGNEAIHQLTKSGVELLVELRESGGQTSFGRYQDFSISSADNNFRLRIGKYLSGSINDAINGSSSAHMRQTGMAFSTADKDNDGNSYGACANDSGWWFNNCGHANLNRVTRPQWDEWSYLATISFSEMKIR